MGDSSETQGEKLRWDFKIYTGILLQNFRKNPMIICSCMLEIERWQETTWIKCMAISASRPSSKFCWYSSQVISSTLPVSGCSLAANTKRELLTYSIKISELLKFSLLWWWLRVLYKWTNYIIIVFWRFAISTSKAVLRWSSSLVKSVIAEL